MKVLTIYAPKGGAGKTTLTRELATAATLEGHEVAIIDLDPQGSLTAWSEAREGNRPALVRPGDRGLSETLNALKDAADFVLIDTPPAAGADMESTLGLSDAVLVPVRPSPDDLRAAAPIASRLTPMGISWAFVVTQAPARARLTEQAARRLAGIGRVAPDNIGFRTAFPEAAIDGRAAVEGKSKPADEITSLWNYAITLLSK